MDEMIKNYITIIARVSIQRQPGSEREAEREADTEIDI